MKYLSVFVLMVTFGCSNYSIKDGRIPSSIKTDGVVEGVVKQVECNRPTGFGAIDLQVKIGDIIESTWYKVNSAELCSKEVSSAIGMPSATKLGELVFKNNISSKIEISKLILKDGFVVDVKTIKTIDSNSYFKKVKRYESSGNGREVLDWYFQSRKSN